jgi:hypothetical protein
MAEPRRNRSTGTYDSGGDRSKSRTKLSLLGWKQKNSFRGDKLDPSLQERLKKLGIHLSYHCRKFKSKKIEEKWQPHFEK